ncbi:MAG: hypothetical protein OSB70_10990 [Myxococcota bacterium]|nr:hypothetical protein [Myxococcota bacterium]
MRGKRPVDLAVLAFFLLLVVWTLAPVLRAGAFQAVPTRDVEFGRSLSEGQTSLRLADLTFYTWLSARNARTLLSDPVGIFNAEICAPTEKSLALSAPGLTLGFLGIPGFLLSDDPAFTYNTAVGAMLLLAAFAMYLLIAEWTGSRSAGVIAGLFYGFHAVRLDLLLWAAEIDTTWAVFALLFSRRLFERGRTRDAVWLGLACCLQMATSFYSFLAAATLAGCFLPWLLKTHGLRQVQVKQLAGLALGIGAFALFLYSPYFELREGGDLFDRGFRAPMPLSAYLPGQAYFFGLTLWILAGVGLIRGQSGLARESPGDPRWPLGVAALATALLAASWSLDYQLKALWPESPLSIPDFFDLAAQVLPGLENIRVISLMASGVHLGACVFAGIGAAAVLRTTALSTRPVSAAASLVALITLEIVLPYQPGWTAGGRLEAVDIRPSSEAIAFAKELGRIAPPGAILELPFDHAGGSTVVFGPERVLLSYYHQRRTSGCYGSYSPQGRQELAQATRAPIDRATLESLRRQGFETLVLHRRDQVSHGYASNFEALARDRDLQLLIETPDKVAYAILPSDETQGSTKHETR